VVWRKPAAWQQNCACAIVPHQEVVKNNFELKANTLTTYTSWAILLATFGILVGIQLAAPGMFVDGVTYAAVARNWAESIDHWVNLTYTATLFPNFVEHPPMHMWLQGFLFQLCGDYLWVEKLYSALTALASAACLVWLWRLLFPSHKKYSFVPVFLWLIIPAVHWAYANNMIENTLTIFTLLSTIFYVYYHKNKRFYWLLLSAISVALAFYTKGFVALYVWIFPFFFQIFLVETKDLKRALLHSIYLVVASSALLAIYFLLIPEAWQIFLLYINKQVVGSLESVQTVSTRFQIVFDYLTGAAVPGLIIFVFYLLVRKKFIPTKNKNNRMALGLLLFSLCGVLPIMISLKQRGFYILTVYPFVAIALAALIIVYYQPWAEKLKGKKIYAMLSGVALAISLGLVVNATNGKGRDADLREDIVAISKFIDDDKVISCHPDLFQNWGLHAYLQRFSKLSISAEVGSKYIIVPASKTHASKAIYSGSIISLTENAQFKPSSKRLE
jgi:4-amino-4-deoxy-L-arabinose transferase-like glycosyltransferase